MKLTKRGRGWAAVVRTEHGRQVIPLGTHDRRTAVRLAKEAKIEELELAAKVRALTAETVARITAGGRVTCEQACARWVAWAQTVDLAPNTIARYETYIRAFIAENGLASKPPAAITHPMLDLFVNPKSRIKAATRANRLNALRSWMLLLVADGLVIGNPGLKLAVRLSGLDHAQKEPAVREPFTEAELAKLARIEDPFWRTAVTISLHTGLRLGDVAQLEWASFARPGRMIVWTDKRDARVDMPLPPAVEQALRSVPKIHEKWVFPAERAIALDPANRSRLPLYFGRIVRRLGVDKTFHSLRHTFATRLAKVDGEPVDTIRRRLGHVLPATTELYIHD